MSDPQYEIRLWLQRELTDRPHGTKGLLAKFMNVRADAITRMMNTDPMKEAREIKAHELELMRQFFSPDISVAPAPAYLLTGDGGVRMASVQSRESDRHKHVVRLWELVGEALKLEDVGALAQVVDLLEGRLKQLSRHPVRLERSKTDG